ncbi:hypothetical protein AK34_5337 [Burkholderia dolosa AU0158]|jgi:hypothetical protein|nr:hypothetical protein AK34_5337 [Burkholderia dolosa AU0158]VWB29354.1 hypothetical protein BDO18943_01227 [Burkholderia dolosa]
MSDDYRRRVGRKYAGVMRVFAALADGGPAT